MDWVSFQPYVQVICADLSYLHQYTWEWWSENSISGVIFELWGHLQYALWGAFYGVLSGQRGVLNHHPGYIRIRYVQFVARIRLGSIH